MTATPVTHWILPFASSLSAPCQPALARLGQDPALPHLTQLLQRLSPLETLEGDEFDLTMPHEKWLARQMGWPAEQAPWALWWARQDGLTLDTGRAWGMLSPCHWLMGRDHLTMLDPAALSLTEAESKDILQAVAPLFESEGWQLRWGHPTRWYASHGSLEGLPTASLDRVIGRNPDVWLTDHPQARLVRRLQSEVQMLLYQHPQHDARQERGALPVNSFWLSGCGLLPRGALLDIPAQQNVQLITTLRQPLLADDMPAWLHAWKKLDATILKEIVTQLDTGEPLLLTLCGERHARTWGRPTTQSIGQRILKLVRTCLPASKVDVPAVLKDL
ncbi:MAG TPA: hypothetical protein VFM33_06530 [Aquabacterium sp.]|nr:hypothetical protein [Aquabacterium sp.]